MTGLVGYLVLFTGLAIFFVLFHLILGMFVRPIKPDPEKLTIYECGEPTIGSAWIQFDLRFYVVALLFVIFDVEVAFFFPWAVVFGKANSLASPNLPVETRLQLNQELAPPHWTAPPVKVDADGQYPQEDVEDNRAAARSLAWIAFFDILVFFGVLLVGYLYLWKRGDLDWVRSIASERAPPPTLAGPAEARELVGAGR